MMNTKFPDTIKVVIKPEHLRGNSYTNASGIKATCPLALALNAKRDMKDYFVGMDSVWDNAPFDDRDRRPIYKIDMKVWNQDTVTDLIEAANKGSQATFELTLTKAK